MKSRLSAFLLALIIPFILPAASAADVIAKASQKLTAAKSLTVKFSGSAEGSLVVSGKNFSMVTPTFGVWYNGTDMWTYSKQAGETSLTTPTHDELLESNPMEILKGYASRFNVAKLSEAAGVCTVKLTPKDKSGSVASAVVAINIATSMPKSIDITFSNNQTLKFVINSITEDAAVGAQAFRYPKDKYPGVEVVDLR